MKCIKIYKVTFYKATFQDNSGNFSLTDSKKKQEIK